MVATWLIEVVLKTAVISVPKRYGILLVTHKNTFLGGRLPEFKTLPKYLWEKKHSGLGGVGAGREEISRRRRHKWTE